MKIKLVLPVVIVVVVLVVLGGVSMYFYSRYQHVQKLLKDPAAASKEEVSMLVGKVSRHILLPANESPQIAKVTDPAQLKSNQFFAQSQAGDVVLIYTQSQKAILFRPTTDRIIEVAPATLPSEVAGTSSAVMQTQSAKLTIYNSTQTGGLASVAEKKINGQLANIQTTGKFNSKTSYPKSVVVILTPEVKDLGTKLAELFNADINSVVPAGEEKPNTELLLIVGEDFKPE
jgi:hypothetical protein